MTLKATGIRAHPRPFAVKNLSFDSKLRIAETRSAGVDLDGAFAVGGAEDGDFFLRWSGGTDKAASNTSDATMVEFAEDGVSWDSALPPL